VCQLHCPGIVKSGSTESLRLLMIARKDDAHCLLGSIENGDFGVPKIIQIESHLIQTFATVTPLNVDSSLEQRITVVAAGCATLRNEFRERFINGAIPAGEYRGMGSRSRRTVP
jgi:hypothetical protein